jgi:hypothetical protein
MLTTKINPDGTIDISIDDTSATLTAEELDKHLEVLARARAKMKDRIPNDPPGIDNVVINPSYTVRTDKVTKASLLRIRHSGFGWLNFEIPAHEVLNMKNMWKTIAERLELDPTMEFNDAVNGTGSTLH